MRDMFQTYLSPIEVNEFYGKRKSRLAGRLIRKAKQIFKAIVA